MNNSEIIKRKFGANTKQLSFIDDRVFISDLENIMNSARKDELFILKSQPKTVLEYFNNIKSPRFKRFVFSNLDFRYVNERCYTVDYALTFGINISTEDKITKKRVLEYMKVSKLKFRKQNKFILSLKLC